MICYSCHCTTLNRSESFRATRSHRRRKVSGYSRNDCVLMDNGRSNLLAEVEQREALYCIRCGACLNACPIYKNIGGHAYQTTYSGPIGSVITPHFKG